MPKTIPGNADDHSVALWASRWSLDVYRYCRKLLRNDAEAEDVMQLVFLQAFTDFDRQKQAGAERYWLLSIARHRCLDRLKMLKSRPEDETDEQTLEHPSDDAPLDEALAGSEAAAQLARCLGELPDHARVAVVLRYTDQLSYEQIETATGTKAGALRVRVLRALPLLKACLQRAGVEW